nr:hypothetical protein BaRGS_008597 [Batillaria attramentaria]
MFHHESSDSIEIPDIEPRVFAILLRYAAKDRHPRLDDENVWEILKAADKYNVEQLTDLCFTFLLLKHSRRKRSRHLCVVLEMAHHLNYTHHHEQLLHKVKRKAARVLKNQDALAELCQQCMLAIVKADDLVGVDEVLVHDAVLKWTQCECARQGRQSDSWEELRDVAGDLVQHVRYLTFPKQTLTGLRAGDPSSCLLTQKELDSILKGDASYFPPTVQRKLVAAFVIGWVVYSIINSFILAQSAEDIDVVTFVTLLSGTLRIGPQFTLE